MPGMKVIISFLFVLIFSLSYGNIFLIGGPMLFQQTLTEEQKITELINYIEKSEAMFVRNGSEFSGAKAAEHLRMKRKKAGSRIKTAKDFIDYIASKSSSSGEPYFMKFKNGQKIQVRDILLHELKKIEARPIGFLRGGSKTGAKSIA